MVAAGCGSGSRRIARILEPGLSIKSAGVIVAILDPSRVKIRVDRGSQGEQAAIDNGVIDQRTEDPIDASYIAVVVGRSRSGD